MFPAQVYKFYELRTWSIMDAPSHERRVDWSPVVDAAAAVSTGDLVEKYSVGMLQVPDIRKRSSSAERQSRVPVLRRGDVWVGGRGLADSGGDAGDRRPVASETGPISLAKLPGEDDVAHAKRIAAQRKQQQAAARMGAGDSDDDAAVPPARQIRATRASTEKEREREERARAHRKVCRKNLRSSSPSVIGRVARVIPTRPTESAAAAAADGNRAEVISNLKAGVTTAVAPGSAPLKNTASTATGGASVSPAQPTASSELWQIGFVPPSHGCVAVRKGRPTRNLFASVDDEAACAVFQMAARPFVSGRIIPMACSLPDILPVEKEPTNTPDEHFDNECNSGALQVGPWLQSAVLVIMCHCVCS